VRPPPVYNLTAEAEAIVNELRTLTVDERAALPEPLRYMLDTLLTEADAHEARYLEWRDSEPDPDAAGDEQRDRTGDTNAHQDEHGAYWWLEFGTDASPRIFSTRESLRAALRAAIAREKP
jgi:hypothetical protein